MPRFSECWRCGQEPATEVCHSCGVAKYCSTQCKRNDVARHDAECRPVAIIQTCSSCRKTGASLKACCGCYRAFYCNTICQENHRPEHKTECKMITGKIKSLAEKLEVLFPNFARICASHYYWGNVPAYDYLNLSENEGADYDSTLNVLVLGVGDLRNIVLTSASLPDNYVSKVTFVLNDSDRHVLARLVLLLYMMIKCDPSAGNIVTEIWYSSLLSEKTYNYLVATLEGLLRLKSAADFKSATEGLVTLTGNHFQELQYVWKRWLDTWVVGTSDIRKQRTEAMNADSGSFIGKINYYNVIPQEHVPTACKYMEDGVFQCTKECSHAENPTLTGPDYFSEDKPYTYCPPTDVIPFTGWDYIEVKKHQHTDCVVTMYGNYIASKVSSFMKKLNSKQLNFTIILGDCMKIEKFLKRDMTYDRILTSNLMDYILLPELLRLYSDKLNRCNPCATLITETMNWVNFCPNADVSMKPFALENEYFRRIVVQDTNDPKFANDAGTTFREYLDNSRELKDYLRALFHVYHKRCETGTFKSSKPPNLNELGTEFQLRLRDGFRNENQIVFFKQAVNRRRVTMITGLERYMEWVAK